MTLECIDEWRGIGPCDQSSVYGFNSATVVFGFKPSCFYEGRPCSLYTCVRVVVHRKIFTGQTRWSYFEAEALHAGSVLLDGRLAVFCRVGGVGEEHALVAF